VKPNVSNPEADSLNASIIQTSTMAMLARKDANSDRLYVQGVTLKSSSVPAKLVL